MRLQDEMVVELGEGVGRLHKQVSWRLNHTPDLLEAYFLRCFILNILLMVVQINEALDIGEETKIHMRLLDNLDSDVEIATSALQVK